MEAAINGAKDELERKAGVYKDKKAAKFLRFARKLKENFHVTRLAKRAGGVFYKERGKQLFFHWFLFRALELFSRAVIFKSNENFFARRGGKSKKIFLGKKIFNFSSSTPKK